jgi:hypothetical protein
MKGNDTYIKVDAVKRTNGGNDMEQKSIFDNLTDEQKEKAKACKTADEFKEFAEKAGMLLTDDELDKVAGGFIFNIESNQLPNYEYNTVIITRG